MSVINTEEFAEMSKQVETRRDVERKGTRAYEQGEKWGRASEICLEQETKTRICSQLRPNHRDIEAGWRGEGTYDGPLSANRLGDGQCPCVRTCRGVWVWKGDRTTGVMTNNEKLEMII
jgi:hypothetical protein